MTFHWNYSFTRASSHYHQCRHALHFLIKVITIQVNTLYFNPHSHTRLADVDAVPKDLVYVAIQSCV